MNRRIDIRLRASSVRTRANKLLLATVNKRTLKYASGIYKSVRTGTALLSFSLAFPHHLLCLCIFVLSLTSFIPYIMFVSPVSAAFEARNVHVSHRFEFFHLYLPNLSFCFSRSLHRINAPCWYYK